jgi:lysophospholipase L1-like esterase
MKNPVVALSALLIFGLSTGCGAGGPGLGGTSTAPPTVKANANIAFMGDSITFRWTLPTTNFGISGNTTAQMRFRYKGDVIGHGYKAVVILGGTNDLLHISLPLDQAISAAVINLQAMAEEAEADNIHVVLCEIPPIVNLDDQVVPLNQAIAAMAKAHSYPLVDYYTPMVGHPEYFIDGIHPTTAGYAVMQQALAQVLPIDY